MHTIEDGVGDVAMRTLRAGVASLAMAGCAMQPVAASTETATLNGRWIVDLSNKPDEPYTKPMELTLAADGSVTGSFYDSEIMAGPYHTAACVVGSGVEGQTWAEHRNFLFNWNAVRG